MARVNRLPSASSDGRARPGAARRELFLGIGAVVVFAVVSLVALIAMNGPGLAWLPGWALRSPLGERAIDISLLHTNDTWGYVNPCG